MADAGLFTVGGPVQAGGGLYLPRKVDEELLTLCREHAFVYILTARQMGKSSLMLRTAERLTEQGVRSVIIDLSSIGGQVTAEQWYLGLLFVIRRQLRLRTDVVPWWRGHAELGVTQRLTLFFEEVLLAEIEEPIVIFIDEIDTTLNHPFTDDFYAAIRSLYHARAHVPAFRRLSFVLIGVATPGDLIRDPQRTPFNIGQRVDLADFTFEEASPLAAGLGLPPEQASQVLHWILSWTAGHPYLTQRLCRAIMDPPRGQWTEADVADRVARTFFGERSEQDNNLQFVRDMLTRRTPDPAGVMTTYRQIRRGQPVLDEEQSLIKSHLKLSGIVRREGAALSVRNRIYQRVFDDAWVRDHLPEADLRREREAYRRGLLRATGLYGGAVALFCGLALFGWAQAHRARLEAEHAGRAETKAQLQADRANASEREAQRQRELATEKAHDAQREAQHARTATAQKQQQQERAEQAARAAEQATRHEQLLRRTAQEALSRVSKAQLDNGVALLEDGDGVGLLDLLEARAAVEDLPAVRESREALWAVWHQVWAGRLAQVVGHPSGKGLLAVAFSPDGKRLATGSEDRTVQLWEVATGRPRGRPLQHAASVTGLTFSPGGRLLAAAASDNSVRLWDTVTGRLYGHVLPHAGQVMGVSFDASGKRLTTISLDKVSRASDQRATVRIWEAASGRRLRQPLPPLRDTSVMALSEDAALFVNGARDKVSLWELPEGKSVPNLLPPQKEVRALALGADGKLLAIATRNPAGSSIRVWNTQDGERYGEEMRSPSELTAMAVSRGGEWLAAVSGDRVGLWDIKTGEAQGQWLHHQAGIADVAFSPNGKQLVTASLDGTARVWNTLAPAPYRRPLRHGKEATALAFSPDLRLMAFAAADGSAELAQLDSGRTRSRLPRSEDVLDTLVFSPDGRLVAGVSGGLGAWVWETATCRVLGPPMRFPAHTTAMRPGSLRLPRFLPAAFLIGGGRQTLQESESAESWGVRVCQGIVPDPLSVPIESPFDEEFWFAKTKKGLLQRVAISPDGRLLAVARDETVYLWETATGRLRGRLLRHRGTVWELAFSPDGQLLATGAADASHQTVRLWETASGRLRGRPLEQKGDVFAVAFSPDGKLLASGSKGRTAILWDTATQTQRLPPLQHLSSVTDVSFTPDGQRLITVSGDNSVQLWDTATGKTVGPALQHPKEEITAIACSPDGKLLATGTDAGAVRLWETATGQHAPALRHRRVVISVAFRPDGKLLVSGSEDGSVQIWQLPERTLSRQEMELRTQVALGARRRSPSAVEAIPWEEWQGLRDRLRAGATTRKPRPATVRISRSGTRRPSAP